MSSTPTAVHCADVHLHPGKEKGPLHGHPWVFSGAIAKIEVDDVAPQAGDWVRVFAHEGTFIGWGHWGTGSIAVRILCRAHPEKTPDVMWWIDQLKACLEVRQQVGLYHPASRDPRGFRWVHGEGDGMSGLVIDVYAGLAVIQTHSMGMHRSIDVIVDAMKQAMGADLLGIVNKSAALLSKLGDNADEGGRDGWLWNGADLSLPHRFEEHGLHYEVDPVGGQKTGFFLDQRDNRKLLMEWAKDQPVLNAFSYTGGFSMAALQGGSGMVTSLDASEAATSAASRHAEANGFKGKHTAICGDVMDHIQSVAELPPVVILDPPAYAKSRKNRHKAVQGYKRLNRAALEKMPAGGLLWTFSCSQVVDAQLFEDTVVSAAFGLDKTVRILRRLGQPADHPALAGHPEARYLKGLVLHIG